MTSINPVFAQYGLGNEFSLNSLYTPSTNSELVTIPTHHIMVMDCSGSMSSDLPNIRNQLKSRMSLLVRELDTVSIIWFSGNEQCGSVIEGYQIKNAIDLTDLHIAIDKYLRPIGLTGFLEPLKAINQLTDKLSSQYGDNYIKSLMFVTDGYDNQSSFDNIINASKLLSDKVDSTTIVEYGYHCNRPLLNKMAETMGASIIFSENFDRYDPIFEGFITKELKSISKVKLTLPTPDILGFAISLSMEGNSINVINHQIISNTVTVPENTKVWWLSVGNDKLQPLYNKENNTNINEDIQRAVYAMLSGLVSRMMGPVVLKILGQLGDIRLIRKFENCFGKQAYSDFTNILLEIINDLSLVGVEGYDFNLIPNDDAYTVIDLVTLLQSGDNYIYPYHESFKYNRLSRKSKDSASILSKSELKRIDEIVLELSQNPVLARMKELQTELSSIMDDKREPLSFVPTNYNNGYPISDLVWHSERPNLSMLLKIDGSVDISTLHDKIPPNSNIPSNIDIHIWRNYTIIKDGIINFNILPISVDEKTHEELLKHNIIDDTQWTVDKIFLINLRNIPLINNNMIKSTSAKKLVENLFNLSKSKAASKVFSHYMDMHFPMHRSSVDNLALYGEDGMLFLESLGFTKNGFNPKRVLEEPTEEYEAKILKTSIAGLSSLPKVSEVEERIDNGKNMTLSYSLMAPYVIEYRNFITSHAYTSLSSDKAKSDLLYVWLNDHMKSNKDISRKLNKKLAIIRFTTIVGQVWFNDLPITDTKLIVELDGVKLTTTIEQQLKIEKI